MTLLLAKLALAPALVVGSSLAGRRWGHALSGFLLALPLVAGPILLITDVQHGDRFAARAASASLLGLAALAAFVVAFAKISQERGWAVAVLGGWVVFVACALALSTVAGSPEVGLAIAFAAFLLAPALMPSARQLGAAVSRLPSWDLPARALATAILVLSLTGAAAGLGPTLTGVLTPFPIATSVLAAFVCAQHGPPHAHALLRGFLGGAFGFAMFCFLVSVLLIPEGTLVAFTVALAGALLAQFTALGLARGGAALSGA